MAQTSETSTDTRASPTSYMHNNNNNNINNHDNNDMNAPISSRSISTVQVLKQLDSYDDVNYMVKIDEQTIKKDEQPCRMAMKSDWGDSLHHDDSHDEEEEEVNNSIFNSNDTNSSVVHDVHHFSSQLNDVLRVLACLYPQKIRNVELIQPIFTFPIEPEMTLAVEAKILIVARDERKGESSDNNNGSAADNDKQVSSEICSYIYSFPNENVWKSVYFQLLPVNERERSHLELARRLWKTLKRNSTTAESSSSSSLADEEENKDQPVIDMILSQFIKGQKYITKDKEIAAIRSLCLHAGKVAAKKSSDFALAANYLNFGISLLDDDNSWRMKGQDEYALTLALYNAAAEMECCIGNFVQMNKLIDKVLESAICFIDKRQAYATRILGLTASKRHAEALETGFSVLHGLGECFPPKHRFLELHFMYEFWKIKRLFGRKSDGQLLRLPPMEDERTIHIMQMLNVLIYPTHVSNVILGPILSLRMMRLTLDYGMSAFAPVAFSHFGMVCTVLGYFELGDRCGGLALELLERDHQGQEYVPRVYMGVYGVIHRFRNPPRENIAPLREAYRVGMITGDLEFACVAMSMAMVHSLEAGDPLDKLYAEFCNLRAAMSSKRQESQIQLTLPFIQSIEQLMGLSNDPLMDLDQTRIHLQQSSSESSIFGIVMSLWQMRLFYIFNDYESAAVFAEKRMFLEAFQMDPVFGFFCTLVAIAMMQQGKNDYWKHKKNAHFGLKQLRRLATASPYDSSGKLCLVQAELASVRGDNGQAMLNYVMAISLTKQVENTFEYALANERTARHILGTGDAPGATRYFQTALEAYTAWGGKAKVDQLQSEMETLYMNGASIELTAEG